MTTLVVVSVAEWCCVYSRTSSTERQGLILIRPHKTSPSPSLSSWNTSTNVGEPWTPFQKARTSQTAPWCENTAKKQWKTTTKPKGIICPYPCRRPTRSWLSWTRVRQFVWCFDYHLCACVRVFFILFCCLVAGVIFNVVVCVSVEVEWPGLGNSPSSWWETVTDIHRPLPHAVRRCVVIEYCISFGSGKGGDQQMPSCVCGGLWISLAFTCLLNDLLLSWCPLYQNTLPHYAVLCGGCFVCVLHVFLKCTHWCVVYVFPPEHKW